SVALSVGVQEMVRSDKAGAGVMFSLDTVSGFPDVVLINAAWGLGETVVQGKVNPDEYLVFKPLLSDPKYKHILKKNIGTKEKKEIYSEAQKKKKKTKTVATSKEEQKQFVLSDEEILILAKWAVAIEKHYQMAM